MSVPVSGSRALRTAWAAFWWRRCSGGAVEELKVSSRNVTPDSLRAADLLERGRGPGLAFHHLGKQSQPHRDDLAVLGKPGNRLIQKGILIAVRSPRLLGQRPVSPPECHQHFPGMAGIEEIDEGVFSPSSKSDLQVPHEPAGGQPEIIPHQHNRLNMLAIAVPKSGDQFGVLLASLRMEPLLELVQDQQHLSLRRQDATPSQVCQRIDQPRSSGQVGTHLAQAP